MIISFSDSVYVRKIYHLIRIALPYYSARLYQIYKHCLLLVFVILIYASKSNTNQKIKFGFKNFTFYFMVTNETALKRGNVTIFILKPLNGWPFTLPKFISDVRAGSTLFISIIILSIVLKISLDSFPDCIFHHVCPFYEIFSFYHC